MFQRRTPTLYQRCATLKIRRRILFHFQCRINVISTLIHNVDLTLKCWLWLSWYAWSFISWKKLLKVVNNIPTVGLWRSLTCQNFHTDISPLIFVTDLVDFYALLSENISFLDYFWRSHIYFVRYCNNPTEVTRNQTKSRYKKLIFFEMFLRGLWDVSLIEDLIEISQRYVMPAGKVSGNSCDDHDPTLVVLKKAFTNFYLFLWTIKDYYQLIYESQFRHIIRWDKICIIFLIPFLLFEILAYITFLFPLKSVLKIKNPS